MSPGPTDTLLAGATGLVGRALVGQWRGPGTLHLLVRRSMAPPAPDTRVHVVDFRDLPALPPAACAVCALGTTIKVAGSRAGFRAVDLDAAVAFATAARDAGVERLAVVSALGADAGSRNFYNRTKGEMEAALRGLGLPRLVIARPSLLAGDRASLEQPSRTGERIALALTKPLAPLIPAAWRPIDAEVLSRALWLALADARPGVTVLESADLQRIGRDPRA